MPKCTDEHFLDRLYADHAKSSERLGYVASPIRLFRDHMYSTAEPYVLNNRDQMYLIAEIICINS